MNAPSKGLAVLALALLLVAGCKRSSEKAPPAFQKVYSRIQAAVAPVDLEWPIQRLHEIRKREGADDVKTAATFELARAWLRLGVLSGIPRDRPEARRVLRDTGMDDAEGIAKLFDEVAAARVEDADISKWAVDGARLTRAFVGDEHGTVSELALGGGPFAHEAAAIIFTNTVRSATAGDGGKLEMDARGLRRVVRYACPDAVGLLKAEPADLDAFAAACGKAPWFNGVDVSAVGTGEPCKDMVSVGGHPASLQVAAFFSKMITTWGKPSESGPLLPMFATRFPMQGACQTVEVVLARLAQAGTKKAATD